MAQLVYFQGLDYATSIAEAFYGDGSFDTVSYENAPSSGSVGDYDLGVTVNLTDPIFNTGWAWGDKFYFGTVEKIIGSQHTDFLYGDAQANTFDGAGSPDFIHGRGGNDMLLGGGGFDYLYGESGDDVIDGQQQTDTLYGGDGNDKIWGGSNYVSHYYPGTDYSDVLYGDAGNDELHGDVRLPDDKNMPTEYYQTLDFMPGADYLHGGSGNDILNGDGGNDTLWGDSGADIFQFDKSYVVKDFLGADFLITAGSDVVADFTPAEGDRLDLSQPYTSADSTSGMVIALLDPTNAVEGQFLLQGVHTFDPTWVI